MLLDKAFRRLLGFADEGMAFVFGAVAQPGLMEPVFGPGNKAVVALIITGSIILVSALSSLLYHYGVLQLIVKAAAWVMRSRWLMRILSEGIEKNSRTTAPIKRKSCESERF